MESGIFKLKTLIGRGTSTHGFTTPELEKFWRFSNSGGKRFDKAENSQLKPGVEASTILSIKTKQKATLGEEANYDRISSFVMLLDSRCINYNKCTQSILSLLNVTCIMKPRLTSIGLNPMPMRAKQLSLNTEDTESCRYKPRSNR